MTTATETEILVPATENDGRLRFEFDGRTYEIAKDGTREHFDVYVVIPERFRPELLGYTNTHGAPACEHVAHDSGKGLEIASVLVSFYEDEHAQFHRVDYADGSRCWADCYPRDMRRVS